MKSRFIAISKNLRKAYIEVKTFMENTTWDKIQLIMICVVQLMIITFSLRSCGNVQFRFCLF